MLNTLQQRSLALDVSHDHIGYLKYGGGENCECGNIRLDIINDDYRQAIENAVYDNTFLFNDYNRIAIAIHSQRFMLVPQELSDISMARRMLEAAFSKLEGGLLTCQIAGSDASIVCDVESGVVGFLRRTFPASVLLHHLAPLSAYCLIAHGEDTGSMLLDIGEKEMHVVVINCGKIQMANTYSYRSFDDVIYYVLNVWKTCQLDSRRDQLLLIGDNSIRVELAKQLRQWIAYALPEPLPTQALQLGRDAVNIPFNLLMLALYENN